MIGLDAFTSVLADLFFAGDLGLASMCIFIGVMMIIFTLFGKDNLMVAFAIMLPVTVMFNAMSSLPDSLTILMVVVAVVGLAVTVKDKVI